MQDKIGEIAGNVWKHLESQGESSLTGLNDALDAPRSKVNMAIGWLAKEGKLEFDEEGRGNSVRLR